MIRLAVLASLLLAMPIRAGAQAILQTKGDFEDKFRQLEEILPTANTYRTASGAPGHEYWQQRADYRIAVEIDDEKQRVVGSEVVTYHNNSPDVLTYLWLQLDQNRFRPDSDSHRIATFRDSRVSAKKTSVRGKREPREPPVKMSDRSLRGALARPNFQGGVEILSVRLLPLEESSSGTAPPPGVDLSFTVVKTMMRVDLSESLAPGSTLRFEVKWAHAIVDHQVIGGRGGYEYFEEDGNYLYSISQWFPRMAAYTDANGWQHKQFLGSGEFTLEFGDYDVEITVPDDHVVTATGRLQNPDEVLSTVQKERLERAKTADRPLFVITPEEAAANESSPAEGKTTWHFIARDVRDFAFATSRKFVWDAWGYHQEGDSEPVLAMSFYPKSATKLWARYSTHAIVQTLEVYSRFTFRYPYPVAISVNSWKRGGMEYPMITFNGSRPEKDDETGDVTYSRGAKYGLIGVVIHEVGHQYFPMIVNSDERQWTWMDEGLNTFVQSLAQMEWEEDYPGSRADPRNIIEYMRSDRQVPIMTNSESLLQFGNNAYAKTSTALNILRETILGRELFDFAFRQYAERWRFKRPMPADFFRTMEDASGIDLDWFWRGWFYSTDHVDISLDDVRLFGVDTADPDVEEAWKREKVQTEPRARYAQRNAGMERRVDRYPELEDFYNENDAYTVTEKNRKKAKKKREKLEDWEKALLETDSKIYLLDFSNRGGLVMPILLEITYEDNSVAELTIPAEIWARSPWKVTKLLVSDRLISSITVDPYWETADVDVHNNHFPRRIHDSRLEAFKREPRRNLMQEIRDKGEEDDEQDE